MTHRFCNFTKLAWLILREFHEAWLLPLVVIGGFTHLFFTLIQELMR